LLDCIDLAIARVLAIPGCGRTVCPMRRIGYLARTRRHLKGADMPPRGVRKGSKRAREYEHIKASAKKRGMSNDRAEEMAARTVNKDRARAGESRTRSRVSMRGKSPAARGGERSGTNRPKGRTREQLYEEARRMDIPGRSRMTKAQLQRAVDRRK
jgi:hypothetical protein